MTTRAPLASALVPATSNASPEFPARRMGPLASASTRLSVRPLGAKVFQDIVLVRQMSSAAFDRRPVDASQRVVIVP